MREGVPVISWLLKFLIDLLSQLENVNTMDILIFDFQRHFQRLHSGTAGLVFTRSNWAGVVFLCTEKCIFLRPCSRKALSKHCKIAQCTLL